MKVCVWGWGGGVIVLKHPLSTNLFVIDLAILKITNYINDNYRRI